ncbi:MAG TPA: PhzF family phenazine biosynthesis protein [Candidatus Dormibacteraeota bacterium]|nr:PhzF family phenazine biosynthesis protein [Candidatus Dormibacteraeota bacterium]
MSDHPRQVRIVDVFTEKPLAGNQLAVVLDGRGLADGLMQRIAREINFSETTFVLPPDDPSHAARIRIFTPGIELPFAGHPTIGTAWVLAHEGVAKGERFTLEEKVGPVEVRREGKLTWMTHPPLEYGRVLPHREVAAAIGVAEGAILQDIPAQIASTGNPFLFVALRDARAVDSASPDPQQVRQLVKGSGAHGVFLFAPAGPGRVYSRMFAVDIAEDPATGSASGPLGAFTVRYGLVERAPRVSVVSEQGTKMGRQSFVHIELTYGEAKDVPDRIDVGGGVMPVLSGTLSDFG